MGVAQERVVSKRDRWSSPHTTAEGRGACESCDVHSWWHTSGSAMENPLSSKSACLYPRVIVTLQYDWGAFELLINRQHHKNRETFLSSELWYMRHHRITKTNKNMAGPDPWSSPRTVFGTGTSRDPPNLRLKPWKELQGIWKLRRCGTLGMVTADPIIHLMLMLVTRHTTHFVEQQRTGELLGLITILQYYAINYTNYVNILSYTKDISC